MSRALAKSMLLLGFLFLSGPVAHAWTPETRMRMVDESIRFMPGSLRLALEGHRDAIQRGMLQPLPGGRGSDRMAPWNGGQLDQSVERIANALVADLKSGSSFTEIARKFGLLSHYVMDAGFPPGMGKPQDPSRIRHFTDFCESRRDRFPLVFYGHDDAQLALGDYSAFTRSVMEQARVEDANLARIYQRAGNPPNPQFFDDRSVPFAVGSLAYSRTITHLVRVWIAAWQSAGGDMGRTPYWTPKDPNP